ncbi:MULTISPECIES: aldo/keto reductase [unclassified Allobranchiibius]|uniref:aldo/keto reductase n=1 Tax=unclassified Allobranchiibius TaxID=2649857 RepID=UPI001AA10C8C|nr:MULTISPECIES: aldo/keto reductase [unclassified Allobranchiibius]MBO1765505.1 aldo/keto reductase [Allobranchiibius sp. GilTou38]UIJ35371.1 aldo/keto reductase [Allobranchiibius sp. GilTou73]
MNDGGLAMALGTMHFGTRVGRDESFALLDQYVDAGGRWIDTANCYAFWNDPAGASGQSEQVIGDWLTARPGMRERVLIGTKVGATPAGDGTEGLSAPVVRQELRASLTRLQTDRVDLYWAHKEDRGIDLAQSVAVFGEAQAQGLVDQVGWSNHPVWRVERARAIAVAAGMPAPTAIQQRWSYLHPRPDIEVEGEDHPYGMMTPETLDYAHENPDVELWGYTALLTGFYDKADTPLPPSYDHPGTHDRLERLASIAQAHGAQHGQIVLAWMRHSDPAVRPIVGVSRPEQLTSAVEAMQIELAADEMATLDA